MYLDIRYVYIYRVKIIYLEKAKAAYNLEWEEYISSTNF
jgi:hypothetical protein